jgi:hypothetical protein
VGLIISLPLGPQPNSVSWRRNLCDLWFAADEWRVVVAHAEERPDGSNLQVDDRRQLI